MSSNLTMSELNDKSESTVSKNLKPILTDLNKIEAKLKDIIPIETNEGLLSKLNEDDIVDCEDIKEMMESSKSLWSEMIKKHREIHHLISKFGRTNEKVFYERIDHLNSYFEEDNSPTFRRQYANAINSLIFDYLLRTGLVDVAKSFLEEETVGLTSEEHSLLREATLVIHMMRISDFKPLREWLHANREKLEEAESMEFQYVIAKLEFLSVLSQQPDNTALLMEKANQMAVYARFFQPDFEYVMGSLAFLHHPERMRHFYGELFQAAPAMAAAVVEEMECGDEDGGGDDGPSAANIVRSLYYQHYLEQLATMFSHRVCSTRRPCPRDPLVTLFGSGLANIAEFHSHDVIFKKLFSYNRAYDFPLTVKRPERGLYHHSIFHCPVDKIVVSGDGSVVRLKCGHAISKSAFKQLTKNEQKNKIKCPYCPHETKTADALPLIL